MRRAAITLLAAGALLATTSCADQGITAAARAEQENLDGRGPITYVQGKDHANVVRPLLDEWNATHPGEEVTFKEQSDNADQQHEDLVQHFQSRDTGYDVTVVDLVWTAEFAARGWLQPLTGPMAVDTSELLEPTVRGASYGDTLYAAPQTSDGALLYYRTDLVEHPPATWDELIAQCATAKSAGIGCYAGQYAKYEGLTVNAAEAVTTAGGSIVGEDGVTPTIDAPEAKAGLQSLVDAYRNGHIPREAVTFQEEQARQAFQSGNLMFMRNWPYAYSLMNGQGSSAVAGEFAVAPLPGKTGTGNSSLGGHNVAINVYSEHKATAHDFLKFMLERKTQELFLSQGSLAPVRADVYEDPELIAQYPYLPTLKTSIENAIPRPISPYYPAVTRAVQNNVYAAIKGDKTVDQAVADIRSAIAAAGS
ncbi:ABC transporter substrate-binding protein [Rhodococcus tibetensis]|uniref:ABC transporter substrate-binding protein n=1 Tax=Rhodococcus tibetensis TaxID=2965064 RepID=A0ABT1QKJ6_9NOCA|nr:ABC transporter substrate-binding protein [Rhodococcus sp. FXJ9.536]MCQ4122769.1 ABC transporter substrate-binding protein [Rhodococcus sp. FXJ9.536]